MRAFLLGTAIALSVLALAFATARPAHAEPRSAPVTAPASATTQATLQSSIRPDAAVADQAGWVQYGVFAIAVGLMLVIGTGVVPRRRS
jgi:hypothetical protein